MRKFWSVAAFATVLVMIAGPIGVAGETQSGSPSLTNRLPNPMSLSVQPTAYSAEESLAADPAAASSCGCNEGCGECGACCDCQPSCCERICSLIAPSDHCFDEFISPMTNPVFFEDPRTLTELRPIFANHRVPNSAGGGVIQVYAVQARAALNDYVSIIATKDGYIDSSNPLIKDGWADVSLGLKFNLYRDVEEQQLLAGGFTYEMPVGSRQSLQGNGDGEFNIFLTGGTQIGCDWHWLSASGFRLAVDPNKNSDMWYWSNHLDRKIGDYFYALTELNWYHWISSGKGGIDGVEGGDFFNFGSTNVAGNDIVSMAWGGKVKPNENVEIGVAYEIPLTKRKDVLEDRLTVDLILRY